MKSRWTDGIESAFDGRLNAMFTFTVNVAGQTRLVTGDFWTVQHVSANSIGNVLKICTHFDDWKVGFQKVNSDPFGKQGLTAPIEKSEIDIFIKLQKDLSLCMNKSQFTMILVWKCTILKVQGLNIERKFHLWRQDIHVALTGLKELYALGLYCQVVSSFKIWRERLWRLTRCDWIGRFLFISN